MPLSYNAIRTALSYFYAQNPLGMIKRNNKIIQNLLKMEGYDPDKYLGLMVIRKNDQDTVKWLYSTFGGDITYLAEKPQIGKMPDAIWNGVTGNLKHQHL